MAAGAGMSMALGCDVVVASDTDRFSQIFSKRGLSVDFWASWLLPLLIGLHRAKELAFFADIIDAGQALGIRPGQPHRPRRPVGRVRFGLGDPPGRRAPAGPVHDQDHVEQLPQNLDGSGPRRGVPFPSVQYPHRGHPGATEGVQPETRATVRVSVSSRAGGLGGRWGRGWLGSWLVGFGVRCVPVPLSCRAAEFQGRWGAGALSWGSLGSGVAEFRGRAVRTGLGFGRGFGRCGRDGEPMLVRPAWRRRSGGCDTGDLGCRRCFERPHAPCVSGAPTLSVRRHRGPVGSLEVPSHVDRRRHDRRHSVRGPHRGRRPPGIC